MFYANAAVVPPAVTRLPLNSEDYYLAPGYRLEPLVVGLSFPTGIAFDDRGTLYLAEAGYSYGPAFSAGGGRILRYFRGRIEEVASGFRPPVTGFTWHDGYLYVAEGAYPGRILRVSPDGHSREVLVNGLNTCGDHYTGDIVVGPDGKLYFGVGTATNSGVVGIDNLPWLLIRPECHDIPCRNLLLNEINYETINIFKPYQSEMVATGGYQPFGVPAERVVKGQLKCNGVIYSIYPDGSLLDIYADGFRNPFALGFSPQNTLYTIDQGYDLRGSRPVHDSPDTLWPVYEGGWYGWPDFVSGMPITEPRFAPPGGDPLEFLLARHPEIAAKPRYCFPHGEIPMKFDFAPDDYFGNKGDIFVAEYGEAAPDIFVNDYDPIRAQDDLESDLENRRGFRVVRLDPTGDRVENILINKRPGRRGSGLERPIDVKFSPRGRELFVLDYGYVSSNNAGWQSYANSGMLWVIRPI